MMLVNSQTGEVLAQVTVESVDFHDHKVFIHDSTQHVMLAMSDDELEEVIAVYTES